jgi:predicted transcriptional regulator
MTAEQLTTIKVSKDLRERISRDAAAQGTTAAGLISSLLDEHEKRARLAAVRRAYATADDGYLAEFEQWDELAGDGLLD